MALVPQVLHPASRSPSPTTEARIAKNTKKMHDEIMDGQLTDYYPRLLCTRVRGPFDESGALWGKTLPLEERIKYVSHFG